MRRKLLKMFLITAIIVCGLLVSTIVVGLLYRDYRQRQNSKSLAITSPDAISESMYIKVGGIDQWVQIRGEHRDNPVLLFLHGGPGFSYTPFTSRFREWEKHFTVVQWDQRGAGRTYGASSKGKEDLNIDRMVSDGLEVSEFLRWHLKKKKVILFAHSWGTILGLPMISRRPYLFDAYVGAGQIVDMRENELKSYELIRQRLVSIGNSKALTQLDSIGPPPYKDVDTWMVKGRLIVMNSPAPPTGDLPNVFALALFAPDYSLRDAYNLFAGFNFSCSSLFNEMMSYDARRLGTDFKVPIFLFQGESDLQSPNSLVQEYFPTIDAPRKEMILLKDEGHTAVLSNPNQFLDRLLTDVRPLALASITSP